MAGESESELQEAPERTDGEENVGADVRPPLRHLSPSRDVTAAPPRTVLNVLKGAAQGFGWLFHSFVFVSDGSVSQ